MSTLEKAPALSRAEIAEHLAHAQAKLESYTAQLPAKFRESAEMYARDGRIDHDDSAASGIKSMEYIIAGLHQLAAQAEYRELCAKRDSASDGRAALENELLNARAHQETLLSSPGATSEDRNAALHRIYDAEFALRSFDDSRRVATGPAAMEKRIAALEDRYPWLCDERDDG
jgi:hypothetical protein